jgi:hypothetical protein
MFFEHNIELCSRLCSALLTPKTSEIHYWNNTYNDIVGPTCIPRGGTNGGRFGHMLLNLLVSSPFLLPW